jgi:hypothetical protein
MDRFEELVVNNRGAKFASKECWQEMRRIQDELALSAPIAAGSLTQVVRDKGKDIRYRWQCLHLLDDRRFCGHLTRNHFTILAEEVDDGADDIRLRLGIASAIAVHCEKPDQRIRELLKHAAIDNLGNLLVRTDVSVILRRYEGDPEVEQALFRQLEIDRDSNSVIYILGKIRSKKAVKCILDILEAGKGNLYKSRAHLALGDIGGDEVCQYLISFLHREKDRTDKDIILYAIGRTKSKMARGVLEEYLHKDSGMHLYAALEGLRLLGEKSVIPQLREDLLKATNEDRRSEIVRTLEALRANDDAPRW